MIKHLIYDTLDINWSELTLEWGNSEIVLPNVVMVSMINKCKVRSIMENNTLLSYIMLLTGVTLQALHKPNALPIQHINFSV